MEHHELAGIIPAMSDAAFAELKADIAANGLLQPILLYEGKVLDGRHRERACEELGVAPAVEQFEGDDKAALLRVLSLNLHRRHLTDAQIDSIAADLATATRADAGRKSAQARWGDNKVESDFVTPGMTNAEAAAAMGTTEGRVKREKARRKTAAKPKKRPKTPILDKARDIVRPLVEAGQPVQSRKLQGEHGISHVHIETAVAVERAIVEARANPIIDPTTLSMSAQEKLAAAIRQHKKQLDAEFDRRVRAEVARLKKEMITPKLEEDLKMAQTFFAGRLSKPLMSKAAYKSIRMALHPDNIAGLETRAEAFRAFEAIDPSLLYSEEAEVRAARIAERRRTLHL